MKMLPYATIVKSLYGTISKPL